MCHVQDYLSTYTESFRWLYRKIQISQNNTKISVEIQHLIFVSKHFKKQENNQPITEQFVLKVGTVCV